MIILKITKINCLGDKEHRITIIIKQSELHRSLGDEKHRITVINNMYKIMQR